jgi:hypothetical protein
MPKLEYFLIAESISVDRDFNEVSVFNILEEIFFPRGVQWTIPKLVACSAWICGDEDLHKDFQVSLEIAQKDKNGQTRVDPYFMNFRADGTRQRVYLRYEYLPVYGVGDILFNLKLNGESRATHTITVRQYEKEEA